MNPIAYLGIAAGVIFVIWVLLHLKTSRADGTIVTNHHPYRRMMWYVMPTRNESVVYFDYEIDAENLIKYVEETSERFPCSMMHVLVGAAARGLHEVPEMNKFVTGHRMYQRKKEEISFSMKRRRGDNKSKIAVVKQYIKPEESFEDMCRAIDAKVNVQRSDNKTYADKEYNLFGLFPRPLLRWAYLKAFRTVDYFNLLPASFIDNDPMYTSIFMANLGSVGMGPGYHHLYEHGTAPLFLMIGKIVEKPVVRDGEIVIRPMLPVRFSYDERIDDGMTAGNGIMVMVRSLEHPYETLGCVQDDGSDAWRFEEDRTDQFA